MLKPKFNLTRGMIILISVTAVVIVASIVVGVVLIVNNNKEEPPTTVLVPDFAPEDKEPNAEKVPETGGETEKGEKPEGGNSAQLFWKDEAVVDLSDNTITFSYTNTAASHVASLLKIYAQDQLIAESGVIDPGYKLSTLTLLPGAKDKLAAGAGYNGVIRCYFYDEETGVKQFVDSEIKISITVQE